MKFYRTTAPTATSIVSVANMEEALAYSSGWKTTTLTANIGAAVQYVENRTDKAIHTQTWTGRGDYWPSKGYFTLPKGNVQSITSVKYIPSGSSSFTTLTVNDDYIVEVNGDLCRIYPPTTGWPTDLNTDRKGVIEIIYVCGPTTAEDWAKTAVTQKTIDLELGQEARSQMVDALCDLNRYYFDYAIND